MILHRSDRSRTSSLAVAHDCAERLAAIGVNVVSG
jgi:hypothetical protein